MKRKILILCHDAIGPKMAGPGIRYQNIAAELEKVADVSLAVYSDSADGVNSKLLTIDKAGDGYRAIFDKFDTVFAQWLSGEMLDYAKSIGMVIIIDLYAPVPIEYLASLEFSTASANSQKDLEFSGIIETYNKYLSTADFFVCSNERQRDFWIGYSTANGLLKPSNFGDSDVLQKFALGPMGISSKPPQPSELKLRSSIGLKADDFVLLWTGGIWDWFDAQVIISAVSKLKKTNVKLVFLGTKHPNSVYKDEMSESHASRQLSESLGLTGKSVFFLDGWVPYDERAAYFMDADAAIYADKESLETRFSHRTRVLDHIWTELPTICSQGDYMSELVERNGFGITVASRTPENFSSAIDKLRTNKKLITQIKHNLHQNKSHFTWQRSLEPLVKYIIDLPPPKKIEPRITPATITKNKKPNLYRRSRKAAKILIKGE